MKTPVLMRYCGGMLPLLLAGAICSSPIYANDMNICQNKHLDNEGLWHLRSHYSVKETLDRLTYYLEKEPGVQIFYRVNQQEIANNYGGSVSDVESMAFEKQQLATRLLSANIESASALPIQATSWKDQNGQVWIQVSDICEINKKYHLRGAEGAVNAVSHLLSGWLAKTVDKNVVIAN
ncbi:hypothetical protein MUU49_00425 [Scandinavium goeteborgense]|uniref:hypothetical protein n=1 Tax=Scandinavium goeteborgense TaxID=1851514 RepID=UPI002165F6AA|nr:hypothetical protein [Scandinavium goeteborgense]MCS2151073.1 hypothetical protein [Scandinavium goeteborgense]